MSEAEIEITIRAPRFEHASTPHNWLPNNPDFGYRLNGGSLTLPYLEPYLIRVMRMAREQLADGSAESLELPRQALLRDIDLFNGQEANHFKIHRAYNAFLRDRYEGHSKPNSKRTSHGSCAKNPSNGISATRPDSRQRG